LMLLNYHRECLVAYYRRWHLASFQISCIDVLENM
jgi:hypothetical protein